MGEHDDEHAGRIAAPPDGGTPDEATHTMATGVSTEVTELRPSSAGARSGADEEVTPRAVLLAEEVERTRFFAVFVLVLASSAVVTVSFVTGGDSDARWVHQLGGACGALASLWVLILLRHPERYRSRHGTFYGVFCVIAIASGYAYWGTLSAVMLLLPIGIYFFALGESFLGPLFLLTLAMVPHAVLSVLITAGVMRERGILEADDISSINRIAGLMLIHFIVISAFVLARRLRASQYRAIERLDRAVRGIAQREALLAEARAELVEVAQIGGPGRYTERTLGSYRLGMVIGRGAMGEIYEASEIASGEVAAVKLLHASAMASPNARRRFLREVEIARSLDVDNVVKVIHVPDPDEPVPYLVMERLHGDSLADILRRRRRLGPTEVVRMLSELGRGVQAAHRAGIVHRDLKPQNLFRHQPSTGQPVWKVLDFGVCKLMDRGSGTLTRGHVVGTPAYMAPEQARGEEVDARCDVYSLSVVAYRALTGRPAFGGSDIPSLLYAVVHDMPPRPSSGADIPAAFDDVLAIGMAKRADDRFADVEELVRAVSAAATGEVDPGYRARAARLAARLPWSGDGG